MVKVMHINWLHLLWYILPLVLGQFLQKFFLSHLGDVFLPLEVFTISLVWQICISSPPLRRKTFGKKV
jgi:hypothetical protein